MRRGAYDPMREPDDRPLDVRLSPEVLSQLETIMTTVAVGLYNPAIGRAVYEALGGVYPKEIMERLQALRDGSYVSAWGYTHDQGPFHRHYPYDPTRR